MTLWLIIAGAFILGYWLVSLVLNFGGKSRTVTPEPEKARAAEQERPENLVFFGEFVLLINRVFAGQVPGWCRDLTEDFGQRRLGIPDRDMAAVFSHPLADRLHLIPDEELISELKLKLPAESPLVPAILAILKDLEELCRSNGKPVEAARIRTIRHEISDPLVLT